MTDKASRLQVKMVKGAGASTVYVDAMTGEVVKDKKYGGLKASAENQTSSLGSSTTRRRTPRRRRSPDHDRGACARAAIAGACSSARSGIAGAGARPFATPPPPNPLVRSLALCVVAARLALGARLCSPRSRCAIAYRDRDARSGVAPVRGRARRRRRRAARRCALQMPVWSPGRYAKMDFAKNVQEFRVTDADGRPLALGQDATGRAGSCGRAARAACACATACSPTRSPGTFSVLDTAHANWNGASLFMYVEGHKPDPVTLDVEPPPGWQIVNGDTRRAGPARFRFENYDRLVDTPTEVAPGGAARLVRRRRQALSHDGAPQRRTRRPPARRALRARRREDRALRELRLRPAAARAVHVPVQHRLPRRRRDGAPVLHADRQRRRLGRLARRAARASRPRRTSTSTSGTSSACVPSRSARSTTRASSISRASGSPKGGRSTTGMTRARPRRAS